MLEITGRRDGQANAVNVYCKALAPNPQLTLLSYNFAYEGILEASLSLLSNLCFYLNHVTGFLACPLFLPSPLIQSTEEPFLKPAWVAAHSV